MLSKEVRKSIATSYYLGRTPADIAREHNISRPHVILIAKREDKGRYLKRRTHPTAGRKPTLPVIEAPPLDMSSDRYQVEICGMKITLPMVSILRDRVA